MPFPHDRPTRGSDCDCLPRPSDTKASDAKTSDTKPSDPSPSDPALPVYVLRYQDAWFGMEKRVTFAAADLDAALAITEREPIGAWAELSQDGVLLCRRGGEPGGASDYWVVD